MDKYQRNEEHTRYRGVKEKNGYPALVGEGLFALLGVESVFMMEMALVARHVMRAKPHLDNKPGTDVFVLSILLMMGRSSLIRWAVLDIGPHIYSGHIGR